jgi:carbonic anhydrase
VADSICRLLNLPVIYNAQNHFAELDLIQLPLKTDFFAARGHNYMLYNAEAATPPTSKQTQQGTAQNGNEATNGMLFRFNPKDIRNRRQVQTQNVFSKYDCGC